MKKQFALLSFIGVGLLIFLTGTDVSLKKRTLDFWLKFIFSTIAMMGFLCFLPLGLFYAFISPLLSNPNIETVAGLVMVLYLYGAGVFIGLKQIELRNADEGNH